MSHQGGLTSKLSTDIANLRRKIKRGQTEGNNPRDFTDEEKARDHERLQLLQNRQNTKQEARRAAQGALRFQTTSEVLSGDNVEAEQPKPPIQDLFVLSCSHAPNILKIASAVNPEEHRQSLEQGHNFLVHLLAVFPGAGHHIEQVQGMMQDQCSRQGKSANWFEVTLEEALEKIHLVVTAPLPLAATDVPEEVSPTHVVQRTCFSAKARKRMRNLKRKRYSQEMTGDNLYIMQNTRIPHEVKIGRSCDVVKRYRQLQVCQNFRITVHAVVQGCGKLESQVHKALKAVQVQKVPGKEWFRCTLTEAMRAITDLIAARYSTAALDWICRESFSHSLTESD